MCLRCIHRINHRARQGLMFGETIRCYWATCKVGLMLILEVITTRGRPALTLSVRDDRFTRSSDMQWPLHFIDFMISHWSAFWLIKASIAILYFPTNYERLPYILTIDSRTNGTMQSLKPERDRRSMTDRYSASRLLYDDIRMHLTHTRGTAQPRARLYIYIYIYMYYTYYV